VAKTLISQMCDFFGEDADIDVRPLERNTYEVLFEGHAVFHLKWEGFSESWCAKSPYGKVVTETWQAAMAKIVGVSHDRIEQDSGLFERLQRLIALPASGEKEASQGLTDTEAEAMLRRLSRHYRQPVMPIRRYCNALRTWMAVRRKKQRDFEKAHPDDTSYPNQWVNHLRTVDVMISKSNLLYRLLYLGEELRTEMCPEHKGKQHMGVLLNNSCECNGTGWLPNAPKQEPTQASLWEGNAEEEAT
jgi:hypothetical protein